MDPPPTTGVGSATPYSSARWDPVPPLRPAYHCTAEDLLLAALARTCQKLLGVAVRPLIDLEAHGRSLAGVGPDRVKCLVAWRRFNWGAGGKWRESHAWRSSTATTTNLFL